MNLRLLHPDTDTSLLQTAYAWARQTPRWFQEMDKTYGEDDFEAYLKASRNGSMDVGVFGQRLEGVIILSERKPDRFECHLMAPRDADKETLIQGGIELRHRLFEAGATEISAWVASRNRPLRAICEAMGLTWYGVELIHGTYRGRLIHWLRYSNNRNEWEAEKRMVA